MHCATLDIYDMDDSNISTKQGNRIKRKSCWFNGTSAKLEDIENVKKYIIEYPFWAYIMHTPDDECSNLHIHFLIYSRGQVCIKSVAETLHCDYGDVQDTRENKTYARYMLHLGWPDKKQYNIREVCTSDSDRFSSFLSDISYSSHDLYSDFCSLRSGRISRSDFVDKYKGELSNMNFYQKIRIFSEIERIAKY